MVTNAQFPDAIKNLTPVTQLYVSVDAATQDSLKKIDRPLFKDFWPRFIDSLKALSDKVTKSKYPKCMTQYLLQSGIALSVLTSFEGFYGFVCS